VYRIWGRLKFGNAPGPGSDWQHIFVDEGGHYAIPTNVPYAKESVYLRMVRIDEQFSFYASENGINWFDVLVDYSPDADVLSEEEEVYVYLQVFSYGEDTVTARFSELYIGNP
jgi:hypothetical protein